MHMHMHPKRKCDVRVLRTSSTNAIGSFALVLLSVLAVYTFPATHGFNHNINNKVPSTTRINPCGRIHLCRNPVSTFTALGLLTRTSTSSHTAHSKHSKHPLPASASSAIEIDDKLPSTVTPILLTVLALIVSEGVALSTLPLHLQSMGATPVQVGLSTSAFSIAQMVMCPLIVGLSSRPSVGRRKTLSICLAGAALSSCVIASSSTISLIIFARFLAGIFAASIPVAQAGVTDLVPPHQAMLALSRVSAASQTGLVIGPIASAVVQGVLARLGVSAKYLVRGTFVASAAFALFVLSLRGNVSDAPSASNGEEIESETEIPQIVKAAANSTSSLPLATEISKHTEYAQPLLRIIALAAGWSLTLSVAIYSLFASRFLGYGQSQLSAVFSAGAATTIATQIFIVPGLVKSTGEHLSATLGLWILAMGLIGTSLIRVLPFHTMLYMLIRVGQGITDTSTATLVARASNGKEERARNLGMIQSTRAGARIFTPLVSGSLFSRSCLQQFPTPGSLPYLINAGLALALTPLPLVLKRMEKNSKPSPTHHQTEQ
jgi:MFS family permease